MRGILLLGFLLGFNFANCQSDYIDISSLEEAINISFEKFRSSHNQESGKIFYFIEYNLDTSKLNLSEKDEIIRPLLNRNQINFKDSNYIFKFLIDNKSNQTIVTGIVYKVAKGLKKKDTHLTDLMVRYKFRID